MVYVTANGAHTDEWSVHTEILVVKSTHRHKHIPTAGTVRMSRLISEELEVKGAKEKQ